MMSIFAEGMALFANLPALLAALAAVLAGVAGLLSALIALFILIPGPQPEGFLQACLNKIQALIDKVASISRK